MRLNKPWQRPLSQDWDPPFTPPQQMSLFPSPPAEDGTRESSSRWQVGHVGRDMMYYEEYRNGAWERLSLDGEMLLGRAHHVIFFRSEADWSRYPAWAHGRRAEIIERIKSAFREPDYEYHGD